MNKSEISRYRYVILFSSVFIQVCLGATYSWAIFIEPLKKDFNLSQKQAQLPFTVFYLFFPLMLAFSSLIVKKLGLKISLALGAGIFSLSWLAASVFGSNLFLLILFIGITGGIGSGIAYMIPIKSCVEWFPNQKGLATGIAVAGFGGGAALLSQFGKFLMKEKMFDPLQTIRTFGICFLIAGIINVFLMKARGTSVNNNNSGFISLNAAVKNRMFLLLYFAMFTGLFAGFAVVSNMKQIYKAATLSDGALAVSLFAVFNALGRVSWGFLHDRIGGKITVVGNLIFQAVFIFIGAFFLNSIYIYFIFASVTGFNYGGILVLYASETGSIWGADNLPKIYGLMFTSNIPGAIAPVFAAGLYDKYSSFAPPFSVISAMLLIAAVIVSVNYTKCSKIPDSISQIRA